MWCCQCQQDVPARPRLSDGALACLRCRHALVAGVRWEPPSSAAIQAGISLEEAYDADVARSPTEFDAMQRERLQEIGRKLRHASPRRGWTGPTLGNGGFLATNGPPQGARWDACGPNDEQSEQGFAASQAGGGGRRRGRKAWGLSCMLIGGGSLLTLGLILLLASFVSQPARAGQSSGKNVSRSERRETTSAALWHWGLAAIVGGEGGLTLGLTWMAARLWRNSRKVSCQLDGVEGHLAELEGVAGKLAAHRLGGSHGYYWHADAAVSPPLAVAQIQDQLDQLSARLCDRRFR